MKDMLGLIGGAVEGFTNSVANGNVPSTVKKKSKGDVLVYSKVRCGERWAESLVARTVNSMKLPFMDRVCVGFGPINRAKFAC